MKPSISVSLNRATMRGLRVGSVVQAGGYRNRLEPRCAPFCPDPSSEQGIPYSHLMQRPAELAPLGRPLRTQPHIDGTLEHTFSSFRRRIFRTLMHRLCIAPNTHRTPSERTQSCP